jgi:hypothetical protein
MLDIVEAKGDRRGMLNKVLAAAIGCDNSAMVDIIRVLLA